MRSFFIATVITVSVVASSYGEYALPMRVAPFKQQVHVPYTVEAGLPSNEVGRLAHDEDGALYALTAEGPALWQDGRWQAVADDVAWQGKGERLFPALRQLPGFTEGDIRSIAERNGEIAVATENGIFIGKGTAWTMALPRQGAVRWAPIDVRAVLYDSQDRLWFACPQGVGYRISDDEWQLFTGAEGLPYNDFTCMVEGTSGIWFGTTNGAIRYADGNWEFRQGRRWLLDNHVRDIAVAPNGDAWIATSGGVSCIEFRPTTLAQKAKFFEEEIEKYHRRTRLGYVSPAELSVPGDKSTAVPKATDNDGHFGGRYLGAASLGYAATGDPKLRQDARNAFEALAFLSKVTEGGTHPAPRGFIARAVIPTTEPNPNAQNSVAHDLERREKDALWKIMDPRWPIDETGEWYWKCDSSSDELDGYYFGFGIYFDRVCETAEEKARVDEVVRRMTDHILDHNYSLVDHDGKPTRWAHFSPDDMNRNEHWWVERGLNSFSILTYLSVAHHITGDQKYRDAYLELAIDHGYGMNGMTQPKLESGPGSFGQADDGMAFMNYYHLARYETDPTLLNMIRNAMFYHWRIEKYERDPFLNFVYAACCLGQVRKDQWRAQDLSPQEPWLEESIDTLKRYPLDLLDWQLSNAHRTDMVPLPEYTRVAGGGNRGMGHRVDGKVFPIDELYNVSNDCDPWLLTKEGAGTHLRDGTTFLLPYYMGLVHGYIVE